MRMPRLARWLMLAMLVCFIPASSYAGIFISVNFGPPVLPVYVQPPCPAPDLIWTPGYWAYGDMGYYWVPGAWVPAPFVGGLWTPGYWGWRSGLYVFNPGYWGYHVGYYGGVNYGGGYLGIGFAGGEWRGGHIAYNTAVVNVNTTIIHNTYINKTVVEQSTVANPNHVAYAGGPGGIQHTAAPQELVAAKETHTPPTSFQTKHETTAQQDKSSWAKTNGGHPQTLAVAKPLPVETKPAPPRPAATMSRTAPVSGGSVAGKPAGVTSRPAATGGNAGGARPLTTTPARPAAQESHSTLGAARPVTPNAPVHTNVAPRPNYAPNANLAPRPNVAPRPNYAPRPNPAPAPNVAPRPSAPPRAPSPAPKPNAGEHKK